MAGGWRTKSRATGSALSKYHRDLMRACSLTGKIRLQDVRASGKTRSVDKVILPYHRGSILEES